MVTNTAIFSCQHCLVILNEKAYAYYSAFVQFVIHIQTDVFKNITDVREIIFFLCMIQFTMSRRMLLEINV